MLNTALETERLIVRRFQPDDAADLLDYLSQPEVVKYEPYEVFEPAAAEAEAARRAEDASFWGVVLKGSNKLIGNVYLHKGEFDTWELGYVFNARYQGKGYASEAVIILLALCFEKQNARRVVAMCNPLNVRSWKLLERLGFRREGHLVENIYFKSNAQGQPIWADTYEYAILAKEWLLKHA